MLRSHSGKTEEINTLCGDEVGQALFEFLGEGEKDITAHSIRKGVTTFAMGGSTAGANLRSRRRWTACAAS